MLSLSPYEAASRISKTETDICSVTAPHEATACYTLLYLPFSFGDVRCFVVRILLLGSQAGVVSRDLD